MMMKFETIGNDVPVVSQSLIISNHRESPHVSTILRPRSGSRTRRDGACTGVGAIDSVRFLPAIVHQRPRARRPADRSLHERSGRPCSLDHRAQQLSRRHRKLERAADLQQQRLRAIGAAIATTGTATAAITTAITTTTTATTATTTTATTTTAAATATAATTTAGTTTGATATAARRADRTRAAARTCR